MQCRVTTTAEPAGENARLTSRQKINDFPNSKRKSAVDLSDQGPINLLVLRMENTPRIFPAQIDAKYLLTSPKSGEKRLQLRQRKGTLIPIRSHIRRSQYIQIDGDIERPIGFYIPQMLHQKYTVLIALENGASLRIRPDHKDLPHMRLTCQQIPHPAAARENLAKLRLLHIRMTIEKNQGKIFRYPRRPQVSKIVVIPVVQ